MGQASKGKVATTQEAYSWVDGVWAEEEIELRVKSMTEKQLYDNFFRLDLRCKSP